MNDEHTKQHQFSVVLSRLGYQELHLLTDQLEWENPRAATDLATQLKQLSALAAQETDMDQPLETQVAFNSALSRRNHHMISFIIMYLVGRDPEAAAGFRDKLAKLISLADPDSPYPDYQQAMQDLHDQIDGLLNPEDLDLEEILNERKKPAWMKGVIDGDKGKE